MQKRYVFVAVVAVVIVVGLVFVVMRPLPPVRWPGDRGRPPVVSQGSGGAAARLTAGSGSARPAEAPPGPVRRLTSDERRRLGEQIAAARQRARAAAVGSAAVDDDLIPVEQVARPLKEGLEAAIPLLAACYEQQPGGAAAREAAALMTMTSDPELGTVIDTDGITDAGGKPLAAKLDECLRDTIDSLALPSLGARGGRVKLQYTFKFD